jgi:uncharacterized protein (UPF0248 family)
MNQPLHRLAARLPGSDRFIFMTDLHLGTPESWIAFDALIDEIKSLAPRPAFVLVGGDVVGLHGDEAERDLQRYTRAIAQLAVPVVHVMGNHDLIRSEEDSLDPQRGKELFMAYLGPLYQSFDWRSYRVITTDTIMARKSVNFYGGLRTEIDDAQLRWLEEQLVDVAPGGTVVVASHVALCDDQLEIEQAKGITWKRVCNVLRDDLEYFELAGHTHQQTTWQHHTPSHWHTTIGGGVGGGFWKPQTPCIDGTPCGYNIVIDHQGTLEVYRKTIGQRIAVASPGFHQTYQNEIPVHTLDTATGAATQSTCDVTNRSGWVSVPIGSSTEEATTAFVAPPTANELSSTLDGELRFEIFEPLDSMLTIKVNGEAVAELPSDQPIGETIVDVPASRLATDWNTITPASTSPRG